MNQIIKTEDFKKLLDVYGGQIDTWPATERAAAKEILEVSGDARILLADMLSFEAKLTPCKEASPPEGLKERIIKKAFSE